MLAIQLELEQFSSLVNVSTWEKNPSVVSLHPLMFSWRTQKKTLLTIVLYSKSFLWFVQSGAFRSKGSQCLLPSNAVASNSQEPMNVSFISRGHGWVTVPNEASNWRRCSVIQIQWLTAMISICLTKDWSTYIILWHWSSESRLTSCLISDLMTIV